MATLKLRHERPDCGPCLDDLFSFPGNLGVAFRSEERGTISRDAWPAAREISIRVWGPDGTVP